MMRTRVFRTAIAAMILWGLCAGCGRTGTNGKGEPLATVNGQPVYDEDVLPEIRSEVSELRRKEYELKNQALEIVVRRRVLEDEAKRHGVTVAKLLDQAVESTLLDPTEDQIKAAYDSQK